MQAGTPDLLGATFTGDGVNFAIQSRAATRVDVCLFDSTGSNETARLTLPQKTGAMGLPVPGRRKPPAGPSPAAPPRPAAPA